MSGAHETSTPDAAFFHDLERRRTRALVDRDLPVLEALHAPEYELITPAGRAFSRERYFALLADQPFYSGWDHGEMRVRATPHMALIRYEAVLRFPSGKTVRCLHTDSYERRDGVWRAVWSQATGLPEEPAPG